MKRKETKLESNLIAKNYKLDSKTYCGKHQDKVDSYIYIKNNGVVTYIVKLDKKREHIVSYCFTNEKQYFYDKGKLEGLEEVLSYFEEELRLIYDFKEGKALDLVDYSEIETVLENRLDTIEEGYYDD